MPSERSRLLHSFGDRDDQRDFHRRLKIAGGVVIALFALLLLRYAWLQIIQHEYFSTRAEDNRIALRAVDPGRGRILDRNGVEMARNYGAYTLEIDPGRTPDTAAVINELSTLLTIDARDRARFLRLKTDNRNADSLPIRTRLTDEEVARFAAHKYRFPSVSIRARLFRQYPLGQSASHVLGHIGRISADDEERIADEDMEDHYYGASHFGKSGIEQQYEFALRGSSGYRQIEVDARGREIRKLDSTAAKPGMNLMLHIDSRLQKITEEAFGERRGAAVAIDPDTGGILALVSMPTYDPNLFVDGIDAANWSQLNTSPDKPMLNRVINGSYPPGSTFKPFMALAALHYGKRTPEQAISDPGYFNFGGHTFRDDKKGGHGRVDMYKSIVESCDTYYYLLANDLGIEKISAFMATLGFGSRTGVDIPSESEGVLPSPQWKRARFKTEGQRKWYAGETISIGIGQGYNAYTPIQLAQATAAIANQGIVYRPHVARKMIGLDGTTTPVLPQVVRRLDVSPEQLATIRHALEGVPREGTSAGAFAGAGYVSAGKTGTAQVFSLKGEAYQESKIKHHLRDHALYIAYAPADKPTIALAIVVENSGFGARAAAPIARRMFDYYLLGKVAPSTAARPDGQEAEDVSDEQTSIEASQP
jgi:penicillin-binding protein 2